MLSSIASFFWGSPSQVTPGEVAPEDPNSLAEAIVVDNGPMETNDAFDERLLSKSLLSLPSVSDEEADWVFVSQNNGESNSSDKIENTEPSSTESTLAMYAMRGKRQRKQNNPLQSSTTRSSTRSLPHSALQASSVLNALAVIRPQQKAQRRQKEMYLKLKQLERTNLVREVNSSSNRPDRRRNRYAPSVCSRAVNNRKC